jgi:nifR3 family TIM-barrel protein
VQNFWEKLDNPFFCLAPMSDVTDIAFRHILAKYSKNRENKNKVVFWTEFVAADGLANKFARKKLAHILKFKESERLIVAQVFGANPENMKKACQYIASLDFDGIDVNMGCPDKSVISQGAGSALIKTPELAQKIIQAAHEGIKSAGKNIPVSVKTRVGFNKEEIDTWIPEILKEDISALIIHLRTKKEMSFVPAHWELMPKIIALRNKISPKTLIIGNGDVLDLEDAKKKALKYGCDGIMIGRGVFGNPFVFNSASSNFSSLRPSRSTEWDPRAQKIERSFIEEKLEILIEHAQIFDKELLQPKHKSFAVMKKHFKAYVNGFEGAKELRAKLMETKNSKEVEKIIKKFLNFYSI